MRLLLMGPPGAGKGTQAARVAAAYEVPPISTGDIFRANVRDRTELGMRAQAFMDAGEYVPDELTNLMVRDRLREPDAADGFLLDGYPRTLAQAAELDAVLAGQEQRLDGVVLLTADHDELVRRLLQRAHEGGRTDDTEPVIRRRLQVYAEQTAPLVEHYRGRGLLVEVDGAGDVPEVAERLANALRVGPPVLGTTPTNTP